ncbi:DUF2399 domain-containing protein [Actinomycetospora endophytica]|uniref:DUF2399 domain-containing protein n=1 Tax=Actinomycetospora endophytica TaxID=2291215 RepID=A0ABS8P453_9PSEU|nr:DUF2399 domain-containing protein [Actinomycetospora endophytica]MCD2193032.1 DUF2399 domain-containing protein [Actinomycetospora endophytica]
MPVPPVLLGEEFTPLWRHVRATLERRGLDNRGWVPLPDGTPTDVRARLREIAPGRSTSRLDLAALERGLARHGTDLLALLADAGCPPTGRREARDAERDRRRDRDEALTAAAREELGGEPWVVAWVDEVRSRIPDDEAARRTVRVVARVLALADAPGERSRGEVAAQAVRWAHDLDRGGAYRRPVGLALALRAGDGHWDDPELWAAAGLPGDLVATPVLTWALPLLGDGIPAAVRSMTAAGAPTPLTVLSLREVTVDLPSGTVVTSVENPRLLEAAVQQGLASPMICTSGNPTSAPSLLIRKLLAAGAQVRHHGDFDPDGVAITARVAALGVVPWRMSAADYTAALAAADLEGVELRPITGPVPETPWDPALRRVMTRAVDEERVMDGLLAEL